MSDSFFIGRLMTGLLAVAVSGVSPAFADDTAPIQTQAGGSVPLTLTMIVDQPTCDMSLLTPNNLTFGAVTARDFTRGVGQIQRLGTQNITLNLTNCGGSAKAGSTPSIQVLGDNPFPGAPTIFSNDGATATGLIGFGLRYQPASGVPGAYLKNEDYVDLAGVGDAVSDGQVNFLVDVQYGGGEVGNGYLLTNFTFRFMYH